MFWLMSIHVKPNKVSKLENRLVYKSLLQLRPNNTVLHREAAFNYHATQTWNNLQDYLKHCPNLMLKPQLKTYVFTAAYNLIQNPSLQRVNHFFQQLCCGSTHASLWKKFEQA